MHNLSSFWGKQNIYRKMKVLAVILVSLFALATCEIEEEENVMVLTADNFDEAIEANNYILVEFYAPWCMHCNDFAPDYDQVARILKKEESNVVLAKFDVSEDREREFAKDEQGVDHLPTLKLYRKEDETAIYEGPKTGPGLLAWLKKKGHPPSVEVHSVEQIQEYIRSYNVLVVGFFRDVTRMSNSQKAYTRAADDMTSTMFVHTHDEHLFKHYRINKDDAVILLKNYDHGRDDFDEEHSIMQIKNFVELNRLKVALEFDHSVANIIFDQTKIKQHVALFVNSSEDSYQEQIDSFRSLAYIHKGKYLFVIIDLNQLVYMDVFRYFSVDQQGGTTLRFIDMSSEDMNKYKPDSKDFSAIGMANFILGVEEEILKPYTKYEELPEDWNEHPVKILTVENFDQVTSDESKGVFVKFYSDKCYNCKVLNPVVEELAEYYKDNKDVTIAKTNGNWNVYPQFSYMREYPYLLYFPKDGKPLVRYTSDPLSSEEMANFIDHDGFPPNQKIRDDSIIADNIARLEAWKDAQKKDKSDEKDEL